MDAVEAVSSESGLSESLAPCTGSEPFVSFILILAVIYVLFVSAAVRRHLWYDELFTLDIASASTPSRVLELIGKWDLNPPLSYFLSRWSMIFFGHGELGLRLPSILEFYAGSTFLFAFARRRIGSIFSLVAILILWEGPLFYYAVEARPYALMFFFFSVLLFCWDSAVAGDRPRWSIAGTFLGSLGLLSSHVFAPLTLFAFALAEVVRLRRTKRLDLALYIALLLPCFMMLSYIPLFRIYRPVLFPVPDQASFAQIRHFFRQATWDNEAVLYATMLALAVSWNRSDEPRDPKIHPELLTIACVLLCAPVVLNLILMPGHRAFWPRYCITTSVTICVTYVFLFASRSRVGRLGGWVAAITLFLFGLQTAADTVRHHSKSRDAAVVASIRPELPLVVENGLTFFEMNHFEGPKVLNRTYYLRDRAAAIRYSNSTLFEDFEPPDRLDPEFQIRAHVESYETFVAEHPQFLMLTTGDGAYWLVRKLRADGSDIEKLEDVDIPYRDSEIYLVTNRAAAHLADRNCKAGDC